MSATDANAIADKPRRERSKSRRVVATDADRVDRIRRKWKCTFAQAFKRIASGEIQKVYDELFPSRTNRE